MKRGIFMFSALLFMAGCQAAERTIKVGILLPNNASGEIATYSKYTLDGINLAAKSKNFRVNGKRIEFVYPERYSGDPSTTADALRELKEKGAKIVIGPLTSAEAQAILPVMSEVKVPVILPAATLNSLTDNEWVWRVCISNKQMAVAAAYAAKDILKVKEVAIVSFTNNPYSQELAESFRNWADAHALKVVKLVELSGNSQNLISSVNEVISSFSAPQESTAVFLPFYYDEAANAIKAFREKGYKGILIGGDGWDVPKIADLVGKNAGENYFITHFNPYDPQSKEFSEEYRKEYGVLPSSFSALGYDAFEVVHEALSKARGLTRIMDIKDALQYLTVDGVTGRIEYSANSHNPDTKGSVLVKFSDFGFQFARRLAVSPVF
ncbi:MAG: ABC transporter substrate-binding protein [candidate division WOR-3 bacterium]